MLLSGREDVFYSSLNPAFMQCKVITSIVVSMQGTQSVDKVFICKELEVFRAADCSSMSYHFLPPPNVQVNHGVERYIVSNLDQMTFESGRLPYTVLGLLLNELANGQCVFTKGLQNCKFLSQSGLACHNLEDIGCPKASQLPDEQVVCSIPRHGTNLFCAERQAPWTMVRSEDVGPSRRGSVETYKGWTNKYVSVESLMAAGFNMCNQPEGFTDMVECQVCGGKLFGWEPGDVPFHEHQGSFAHCSIVKAE